VFLRKEIADKIKAGHIREDGSVFAVMAPGREDGERCRQWIAHDLTEIDAQEAERLRPGLFSILHHGIAATDGMYTCRQYDWENNLCKRHHDKPSICADFPHYLAPSTDDSGHLYGLPNCGYWPDYPEGAQELLTQPDDA
jgi:Fe-S-cluster containining protein